MKGTTIEDILKELNAIKQGYRVVYKWWVFHVYKQYDDDREHHLGVFPNPIQVKKFIASEENNIDG